MAGSFADSLPGELQVCYVSEVQLFLSPGRQYPAGSPVKGDLTCTNFRMRFTPSIKGKEAATSNDPLQMFFGAIQTVCSVSGNKRRVLDPKNTLPRHLESIEVTCKDFRRIILNFKNCRKSEANSMMNAILIYSQPQQNSLMFAFDYAKELKKAELEQSTHSTTSDHSPLSYLNARDWEKELQRLSASGSWRVCEINRSFTFSDSLPPYFVVPESVGDQALHYVARHHHGNRLPIWCWSHPANGTSIIRCSNCTNTEWDKPSDVNYISAAGCGRPVQSIDLNNYCTVKDVAVSYSKLKELCMPVTEHDYRSVERKWMSQLHSSRWLDLIRLCLKAAVEAKEMLCETKVSVMLIETDGRDISCIVSCLIQLLCDTQYRSISGFEKLIQKEWVAMGHAFCIRNKLTSCPKGDDECDTMQAPVFLLFLDCVWQLTEQFVSAFEFSGVFLEHLHLCSLSNLYGTFVFDSAQDMYNIVNSIQPGGKRTMQKPLSFAECVSYMESAWGVWTEQLGLSDKEDYLNPLYYLFSTQAKEPASMASPLPIDYGFVSVVVEDEVAEPFLGGLIGLYDLPGHEHPQQTIASHDKQPTGQMLTPNTSAAAVKLWSQLYLASIPELSGPDRERLLVQRHQSQLVRHIRKQRDRLHTADLAKGTFAFDLMSSSQSLGSTFGGSSDLSGTSSPLFSNTNGITIESAVLTNIPNRRETYHGEETEHSPVTRSASSTPHSPNIIKTKLTIRREKDAKKRHPRSVFTAADSPPIIMTKKTTIQIGHARNGKPRFNDST